MCKKDLKQKTDKYFIGLKLFIVIFPKNILIRGNLIIIIIIYTLLYIILFCIIFTLFIYYLFIVKIFIVFEIEYYYK